MQTRNQIHQELQKYFDDSANHLVLLTGSDRSEKESFLARFCQDKKSFYYRGRHASGAEQLKLFSRQVAATYDVKLQKNTYDECLNRIKSGDASKLVVIIDELPLITHSEPGFFESIIKLKKRQLYPGPVLIIATASYLSYADGEARDLAGDGYSYFDSVLTLPDYNFLEVVRVLPKSSMTDALSVYAITGGVPAYMSHWNRGRSVRDNVISLILSPHGALFDEAQRYIGSQLRELSVYETILYAMASGNEKLNDIYQYTGYPRAKISVYLKNLAAFEVIEKVVSFTSGGWENTKKGVYRIREPFIDFWFKFVYGHQSELWQMKPEDFYDEFIEPYIKDYLERIFERVCSEYIELLSSVGKTPIHVASIGTWIGKEGTIDIVGADEERNTVVGSCLWGDSPMGVESYENLLLSMKQARLSAEAVYLFSGNGFSEELSGIASKDNKVNLIDLEEL
ncbi:MAG: ATP-binding protein [Lachnospiraceae bacterium]|nr:ATP-binding protein [Lachnospiraceae bacterium]